MTAFNLNSSWLVNRILLSFSLSSIPECEFLQIVALLDLLDRLLDALLTSGISIFETRSKLLSGMDVMGVLNAPMLPEPSR